MVAHRNHRAARRRAVLGLDRVHQTRARPVSRAVETGFFGLRADLTVGRQRGIDQSLVDRRQRIDIDLQALACAEREIGDEDIGLAHQPIEYRQTLGMLEIDRHTALVAGIEIPGVGFAGQQSAIGIALERLDLDDLGTEVRQDGGGGRTGHEACAIDDLQALEGRRIKRVVHRHAKVGCSSS